MTIIYDENEEPKKTVKNQLIDELKFAGSWVWTHRKGLTIVGIGLVFLYVKGLAEAVKSIPKLNPLFKDGEKIELISSEDMEQYKMMMDFCMNYAGDMNYWEYLDMLKLKGIN